MTAPTLHRPMRAKDAVRLLKLVRVLLQQRGFCGRWSAPEVLCCRYSGHGGQCGGAT